ncbi:hypothetical protein GGR51DRAFT_508390 [Nemania sp. FL0031]|nr:hypothetical protein GGR51DRAFT_508390 [Nemania sp. FL0031]
MNPVPKPGPNDLLVKVIVAGYCYTDGLVATGAFKSNLQQTSLYEASGTVVAVGNAVSSFRLSHLVMCGIPLHLCSKCEERNHPVGRTNLGSLTSIKFSRHQPTGPLG